MNRRVCGFPDCNLVFFFNAVGGREGELDDSDFISPEKLLIAF
jgi:hypothetical protein